DEETRTDEFFVLPVFPQDVADVLAKETLDAFAELLHAFHVLLLHTPCAVLGIGTARTELADRLLHAEVPGDIGHQIADRRERVHRLEDDRHIEIDIAQPGHAHQFRHAVDFRRAGAAFSGLAVPAHGEIGRLLRLDAVHGIKHHHALIHLGLVIDEFSAAR